MSNLHLSLRGQWVECHATQRACPRPIHVPGMSVAEIEQAPAPYLDSLFELMDPPDEINKHGAKLWLNAEGQLHRDYGLPAMVRADGTRQWYRGGHHHRDGDLPATIQPDGTKEWWEHGQRRRASRGPTTVLPDGTQLWGMRERLHRAGGLPALIGPRGNVEYWEHGKLHRLAGPAVREADGSERWYLSGKEVSSATAAAAYADAQANG